MMQEFDMSSTEPHVMLWCAICGRGEQIKCDDDLSANANKNFYALKTKDGVVEICKSHIGKMAVQLPEGTEL